MAGVETDPQIAERARGVDPEPAGTPVIARAPAGTPPAGMAAAPGRAAPAPDGGGWDDGAVKWLLAAGLLRKLLAIARSFFANELDLRDWMAPGPAVDFTAGEDVWFDYIADTGDDARAMYALACGFERSFAPDQLGGAHPTLPVGKFLFVGGDTAYYISDEPTLRRRFVGPLNAAHARFGEYAEPDKRRPIFAIPGNHDYYDHLTGFNRLFRTPYPPKSFSVLKLDGFKSGQEASYVKIRLPHAWELWGVDLQAHGVDYRQRLYFRDKDVPKRLILCTPTPPVSLNRVQVDRDPEDAEYKAYLQLLADPEQPGFAPAFTPDTDGTPLPDGECRLYLSGDDHHYARYNGQRAGEPAVPTSVATVVSGGGGAFTHPTEHTCGTIPAAVKYPTAETSADKIASALVNPLAIIHAGLLHFVGAGLALLFCWAWPHDLTSLRGPAMWTGCVAASLGLGAGSLILAQRLARHRSRRAKQERHGGGSSAPHEHDRRGELSVFVPPIGFVAMIALPLLLHRWIPQMDPLSSTSLWLLSATILVIALVGFASLRGADSLTGAPSKIGFALLGLVHAALLLGLPYLMVSRGWLAAALAIVAMMIVFAPLAKRMYRRAPAWSLTALWLIQGLGVIAALWWGPWPTLAWSGSASLLAIAVGAIVVPMQFGFYLLTCSAWNGHNNEAGITARLTLCKQWIRFHVTRDAVTGYVIGLDDPVARPLEPRLIDTFVIAPKRGGV